MGYDELESVPLGNETLTKINQPISMEQDYLKGKPDVGTIRVSRTPHRARFVDALLAEEKFHFKVSDRDENNLPGSGKIFEAGKKHFDSGKEVGEYGISCINGMQLSPFGLLNIATGKLTRQYPQGRMMVPFKGLKKSDGLANPNDDLGKLLENVIVLKTSELFNSPPDYIFVYDGKNRVRKIEFDHATYRIISDVVVRENVTSLDGLEGLKKVWWGDKAA